MIGIGLALLVGAEECGGDDPATSSACTAEVCDGEDNDCDGEVDEGLELHVYYADRDADGFGDPTKEIKACAKPKKHKRNADDCDDEDAAVSPLADEYCDGFDNDCDGKIDEKGSLDVKLWYLDADADGLGDPEQSKAGCEAPTGYVANKTDCDDGHASVNPSTVWYYDSDKDGFGDSETTYIGCASPGPYTETPGDCSVGDPASYPGAEEVCLDGIDADGVDNDCDGEIDEGCPVIHCGGASGPAVWGAGTHLVTCSVTFSGALTIDDGAIIELYPDTEIEVGHSTPSELIIGGLGAEVVIRSADGLAGSHRGLTIGPETSSATIEGLTIEDGGQDSLNPGTLMVRADAIIANTTIRNSGLDGLVIEDAAVELSDVVLTDNARDGLSCLEGTCLSGTPTLTATTNGRYPATVSPQTMGIIGDSSSGSVWTGNTDDRIAVTSGTIADALIHSPGLPWLLDELTVEGEVEAEDGAELQFLPGGTLILEGALTSEGNATLTSASAVKSAGDWNGVMVSTDDARLSGVTISFASTGVDISGDGAALDGVHITDSAAIGVAISRLCSTE